VTGVPEANATQAAAAGASLALYLGDCAYGNGSASAPWDAWFTANTPLAADRGWLPTIGNHDFVGMQGPGMVVDGENFFGRFALPAPFGMTSPWWSIDYEGVHFIFLSGDLYGSFAQLSWLQSDLASNAAKTALWRIVLVHQPAFSSSCFQGDPYEDGVRTTLVPVFDTAAPSAHVDLVLQGHRHVYERTYMLKAGPTVDTASYDSASRTYTMPISSNVGTVYVTSGGGGQSLHGWVSATPPAWSANRKSFYHWMLFHVTSGSIVAEVHDTQASSVFETFTISRGGTVMSDAGGPGPDASSPSDASSAADARTGDGGMSGGGSGGCGCSKLGRTERAFPGMVAALALVLAKRRRR
jgi:3',5'-cyclic AMP phosphodiesterase CpdA